MNYNIRPLHFSLVQVEDNFWKPRQQAHRENTLPHVLNKCRKTKRIKYFEKAAGLINDDIMPYLPFDDSDVYKIIEGASYSLMLFPDSDLENDIEDIIKKIAGAQEKDGYLYTARTMNPENPHHVAGKSRWETVTVGSAELYNVGHLYESAVAHFEATGRRDLLDIAIKNATLIDKVFGPGKNESPPGHQEIELGLVRLYHATRNEKYLRLAQFFLDIRGDKNRKGYDEYVEQSKNEPELKLKRGFRYNQTHARVIDQEEAFGHAVRALYMYSAMVDVGALTNNEDYIKAVDHIWENIVSKKLYITGSVGNKATGEAFGRNYQLSNLYAYNETCAAIGLVYFNHKLFLLHGDSKYIDLLERTLYNGLLSGYSLNGKRFFYLNPLASKGAHGRKPWYPVPCCVSNLARFIPSIPGYMYANTADTIYVNLFVGSTANISVDGKKLSISQETDYPWSGKVKISIKTQESVDLTIAVRIPGWARNSPVPSDLYQYLEKTDTKTSIKVNDEPINIILDRGFVRIHRKWKNNDVIEMDMPMPIRRVITREKVRANRGKIAFERGPIVYCVESFDNDIKQINDIRIDDDAKLSSEFQSDMLNGIMVIKGNIHYVGENADKAFLAIPYYSWAHRGRGEMTVWMSRS